MGFYVSKAPALLLGIVVVVLPVLGLSGVGFSRGVDWVQDDVDRPLLEQLVGPQFPKEPEAKLNQPLVHNYYFAESQFIYVEGLDVSKISSPKGLALPEAADEVLINEAVLRVAYAQYLVSLLAAKDILNKGDVPLTQNVEVVENTENVLSLDQVIPELPVDIKPAYLNLTAPIPHQRGRDLNQASIQNGHDGFVSVSVASILRGGVGENKGGNALSVSAPIPAAAHRRPILVVQPASVRIVQTLRGVSLDRLVHAKAQGSWPRRLDQINTRRNDNRRNDNIFMQNWGQGDLMGTGFASLMLNGILLGGLNN